MDYGPLVAILAGVGALVAAGAGLLIVVHNARDKGRHAALAEAEAAELDLEAARAHLVDCRRDLHAALVYLADNGLEGPP